MCKHLVNLVSKRLKHRRQCRFVYRIDGVGEEEPFYELKVVRVKDYELIQQLAGLNDACAVVVLFVVCVW